MRYWPHFEIAGTIEASVYGVVLRMRAIGTVSRRRWAFIMVALALGGCGNRRREPPPIRWSLTGIQPLRTSVTESRLRLAVRVFNTGAAVRRIGRVGYAIDLNSEPFIKGEQASIPELLSSDGVDALWNVDVSLKHLGQLLTAKRGGHEYHFYSEGLYLDSPGGFSFSDRGRVADLDVRPVRLQQPSL